MLFGKWGGKGSPKPESGPGADLPALLELMADELPALEQRTVELLVVRAGLQDRFRDLRWELPLPAAFDREQGALDVEAARRFSLVVRVVQFLPEEVLAGSRPRDEKVLPLVQALAAVARSLELHTVSLMHQSDVRLEEFVRRVLAILTVPIAGETRPMSQERLARLDYARLLKDAGLAKASAEQRAAYLKELQDQQGDRARRGKF